jgi:16S rRNA (cytidine1402-2'-O)-methyltransferase
VTTALAVSGLPSERFCFEGFVPRKHSARLSWLNTLAAETRTCVFFESPRRLADTLRDAIEALGTDRKAVVCRELTKTHEEIVLAAWRVAGVGGRRRAGGHRRVAGATPKADGGTGVSGAVTGCAGESACAEVIAANPARRHA